jgi:chorismate synthase
MRIPLMKYIASYLAIAMFILGIVPRVEAGFVPSDIITHSQIDRTEDLQRIQKVLETKMVKERLENLGFTKDEIQKRLSQLNDEQIHNLALNLDQLKVGGDGLGVIVALLVIALLVVVLIYLTKHRVIIK